MALKKCQDAADRGRARLRPMPGIARGLLYDVAPCCQIARRTAIELRRT